MSDEWRLDLHDEDIKKSNKDTRVDHYWCLIFQLQTTNGNPRQRELLRQPLCCHKNDGDVERGVSVNSKMSTTERNKLYMYEETINELRSTKDMIKFSAPQSHRLERIQVTKKILNSVRSAHLAYRQKCEEESEEKERKKK